MNVDPTDPYLVATSHDDTVMVRETPEGRQIAVWRTLRGSDDVQWPGPTVADDLAAQQRENRIALWRRELTELANGEGDGPDLRPPSALLDSLEADIRADEREK